MKLKPNFVGMAALAAIAAFGTPATATLPAPSMSAAMQQSQAYLFHAGAADIFEITSSMILLDKSGNPQVRAYASMLIDHHTRTTNLALASAKAGGIMPPPPEMSPMQKGMIGALHAAAPAAIDRLYLQQQIPAHQQALALQSGYSRSGDNPALRQAAQGAVPIVRTHLTQAQRLMRNVGSR